jgi:protein gp37
MSEIEWTDETWNPTVGCSIVSPGCTHCYAMKQAERCEAMGMARYEGLTKRVNGNVVWTGEVRLVESVLEKPLHWRAPRRVFVNSMSDLFHEGLTDEQIEHVFAVMAACPQHTFQVLTKRPERMQTWFARDTGWQHDVFRQAGDMARRLGRDPEWPCVWPLPNVWLGVSVEDQRRADERIPLLLQAPAAVRFLSCEPLLGPVDLSRRLRGARQIHVSLSVEGALADRSFAGFTDGAGLPMPPERAEDELNRLHQQGVKLIPMSDCPGFSDQTGCPGHRTPGLDWVITGGESGPKARPANPDWFRQIRDQCVAAGIAYFHKQNGEWARGFEGLPPAQDCAVEFGPERPGDYRRVYRVGKKRAGRLLDGREWSEFPEVRAHA